MLFPPPSAWSPRTKPGTTSSGCTSNSLAANAEGTRPLPAPNPCDMVVYTLAFWSERRHTSRRIATGVALASYLHQQQSSLLRSTRAAHLVRSHSVVSSCSPAPRARLRAAAPRAAPFVQLCLPCRLHGLRRTCEGHSFSLRARVVQPLRGGKEALSTS